MAVIWITGLPGVGKTRAAEALAARMRAAGEGCVVLDGDRLRLALAPLINGYDVESRRRLAHIYAGIAELIAAQGITTIVATVSLFTEIHARNRHRFDRYVEVFLVCDEVERANRQAGGGAQKGPRVGVEIVPEFPCAPDLILRSDELSSDAIAIAILEYRRGHIDVL